MVYIWSSSNRDATKTKSKCDKTRHLCVFKLVPYVTDHMIASLHASPCVVLVNLV